jgi:para-aminobenzoate synthetase
VHGRKSAVFHNEVERGGGGLFAGIPSGFHVVRYHSLALVPRHSGDAFPQELERTAWTQDGVIMGLQHRKLPLWGVQFHPESICTQYGAELLGNFLALADAHNASLECTLEASHSNASTPPSAQSLALESTQAWVRAEEPPLVRAGSAGSPGENSCGSACGLPSMRGGGCESCPPVCGHSKLMLLHRVLETRLEAETFFMSNLAHDARSFWLDSSRREHAVARFSYMGGSRGPLSYQVR